MTETAEAELVRAELPDTRPPVATAAIAAVAAVFGVVLFLSTTRYGFFGDELYFLAAGRRLSVGYADQGPVLPALAHLLDLIAPGSMVVLRLPAVALTVAAVVFAGLLAREFGGGRAAQVLAALGYATSPFLLLQGNFLSTNTVDCALWVFVTWLLVRWVHSRRDVQLLAAVALTAIDLQIKWLIPFFWIAVALSASAVGPRDLLRRPVLWWGATAVLVSMAPNLIWQSRHGWPQLAMGRQISTEQAHLGGRLSYLPSAWLSAGLLGGILLGFGLWRLFRAPRLRPFRFLGLTLVLLLVIFITTNGRAYYAAGMYAVTIAAGAVEILAVRRRWLRPAGWIVVAVSVAFLFWATPWQSPQHIHQPENETSEAVQICTYGQFGWSELRAGVAAATRSLNPAEREHAVVVTKTYWQASALDRVANLPPVYSPNRGFGYFGAPPDSATTVLYVGKEATEATWLFGRVEPVAKVDSRLGFLGNTRGVTIWKCSEPKQPWSKVWPSIIML